MSNPQINPYASPAPDFPVTRPPIHAGSPFSLWREGKRMVVKGPNFSFPARCIKTNKTHDLVPKEQNLKYLPGNVAWTLMFGVLGAAIAQALFAQKMTLTVPVSQEWLANKRKHYFYGVFTALGGLALFILAFPLMFALEGGNGGNDAAVVGIVPLLLGIVVGVGGLIYMAASDSTSLLTAYKMDGAYAWLDGVSPEFLASLPDWAMEGPVGMAGVKRR